MSKSTFPFVIGGAALVAAASMRSPCRLRPDAAAACAPGKPSVIVHVAGFKQPTGKVKVSLYGSDADRWLAKGGRITKVKVPVTGQGDGHLHAGARAWPLCGRGPS